MTAVHTGPVAVARNFVATREGSIHNDEAARRVGLPGGIVGGNVQVSVVHRELVEVLGAPFFERGFMRFAWIAPAYDSEGLRATLTEVEPKPGDDRLVEFALHRTDGTLLSAGFAGLARDADHAVPPWERPDAAPAQPVGDYDPLPDEAAGHPYPTTPVTVTDEWLRRAVAGYEDRDWYTSGSPWGGPVVPTVAQLVLGGFGSPDTPRATAREMRAGMNNSSEILQTGPMFVGTTYERRAWLVGKGAQGRYAFRTLQFETLDEDGRRVNVFRWKIKWATTRPEIAP